MIFLYIPIFQYPRISVLFFFTDPPTTEIYTLSLHDALPISPAPRALTGVGGGNKRHENDHHRARCARHRFWTIAGPRSEEHTSELQSHSDLVCRLLLEKKKKSTRLNSSHEWITYHGCCLRKS